MQERGSHNFPMQLGQRMTGLNMTASPVTRTGSIPVWAKDPRGRAIPSQCENAKRGNLTSTFSLFSETSTPRRPAPSHRWPVRLRSQQRGQVRLPGFLVRLRTAPLPAFLRRREGRQSLTRVSPGPLTKARKLEGSRCVSCCGGVKTGKPLC